MPSTTSTAPASSTAAVARDRDRSVSWVDRNAYPFRSRWLTLPEGRRPSAVRTRPQPREPASLTAG